MTWRLGSLAGLLLLCACSEQAIDESDDTSAGAGGFGGGGGSGGGANEGPLGRVFERTPDHGPAVERPLTGLEPGATTLTSASVRVFTCASGGDLFCANDAEQLALADANGNFFYDPILDAMQGNGPAAEVNTYYHVQRFLDRFAGMGFEGVPAPVNVIVGIDPSWGLLAGATDVFGSAGLLVSSTGDRNLAFDPDVYGHELTHIVMGYASRAMDYTVVSTGVSLGAGALTEGSADYFSCAFMGDPDVGEYSAVGLGAPYFSSVDNGSTCPDDLYGESHHDGQIWSAALWEIRQALDGAVVDQAVYDTLAALPPGSSLADAAAGVRAALSRVVTATELADVDTIFAERGLTDCEPIADLVTSREMFVLSGDLQKVDPDTGEDLPLYVTPAALQLRVTVPASATRVTITVTTEKPRLPLDEVAVHLRYGMPVAHAYNAGLATVSDGSHAAGAAIVIDAGSVPPLASGDLYLSLVNKSFDDGEVTVTATIE